MIHGNRHGHMMMRDKLDQRAAGPIADRIRKLIGSGTTDAGQSPKDRLVSEQALDPFQHRLFPTRGAVANRMIPDGFPVRGGELDRRVTHIDRNQVARVDHVDSSERGDSTGSV